jgi:diguanylate cyclase (GGDEF)-like protein
VRGVTIDITDRKQAAIAALQREFQDALNKHDPVTGAITRFGILPTLREQQELVKRQAQICSIVMVDLNNLKAINDRYGHLAGDLALAGVAHHLIDGIRPYDKVFRYGGDEFLLCLQHAPLEFAVGLAKRLSQGLAAKTINIGNHKSINISAAFGVALLDADIPVETSIDRADKAMYAAKAAKGSGVQGWSTET